MSNVGNKYKKNLLQANDKKNRKSSNDPLKRKRGSLEFEK